jgi:CRISPR-associated protein Cmr4
MTMDIDNFSMAIMYAISPCHAGSGSALGTVDLPIQRERHTNWPFIQSSGMKGAFRANFDRYKNRIPEKDRTQFSRIDEITESIFGAARTPDSDAGFAGAISVSDAKILAFPMRSNKAPFVWITCPAVLRRLNKDLGIAGKGIDNAAIDKIADQLKDSSAFYLAGKLQGEVLLEDYSVTVQGSVELGPIQPLIAYFSAASRLLLVQDDIFDYGVSDCTQITAQISIDQKTGTTSDGSLRYTEELPADTLMYCMISWGDARNGEEFKADTIRRFIKDQVIKTHIQVGGDETLGRGLFELEWK